MKWQLRLFFSNPSLVSRAIVFQLRAMTFSTKNYRGGSCLAIQKYNDICKSKGIQICLPQPFHKCTSDCSLVEIKGLSQYVCEWSRNVHVCGEHCTEGERLKDNSGYVCRLTGRILPQKIYTHYELPSKTDTTKRKHDHHTKMATGRKKRRKINSIVQSHERLLSTVRKTVVSILCSTERISIFKKAHDRFIRDVKIQFKSAFTNRDVDFLQSVKIIRNLKKHYARSLNQPIEMNPKTIDTISQSIAKYFIKIQKTSNGDIADTVNSVEIFTACILSKLASGFTLGSVDIIPKMFFFARHVPADIQFKELPNIRCRSMSVCTRAIQAACLTPSGHARIDFKFAIDFGRT